MKRINIAHKINKMSQMTLVFKKKDMICVLMLTVRLNKARCSVPVQDLPAFLI